MNRTTTGGRRVPESERRPNRSRRRTRRDGDSAFKDKEAAREHARVQRRWLRATPARHPGVDEYGFHAPDSPETDLEVTPGHWRQAVFSPRNVVTDESRIGVKPILVARAGRSGDAQLMAAAPRMLAALLACERELSQQLRDERQLMRQCEDRAARGRPGHSPAAGRRYIRRMRESAALAWTRIASLEAALAGAREAVDWARPEFADEQGWHWPDYGIESGEERDRDPAGCEGHPARVRLDSTMAVKSKHRESRRYRRTA